MILELEDLRQKQDYDCGAVAVDVVARFHGLRTRGPVALANPVQGMSPDMVEHTFRSLGLSVLSGTMTVEDLRHLTRTGRPVLCPMAFDGGHWVACAGVSRGRVHFHDPAEGPRSLRVADWEASWRDTSRSGHEFDRWGICPSV